MASRWTQQEPQYRRIRQKRPRRAYPIAVVPQCAETAGLRKPCIFEPFWEAYCGQPSGIGGTGNWSPCRQPDTGYLFGTVQ
jgi:hypothetical protein